VTLVRRNAVANLIGRLWGSALPLLFLPVYLQFLGVEAYGLVGFSATLQGVILLLDAGIGATLLRELARLSAEPGTDREKADLVGSLEPIYWCISFFGGCGLWFLAPAIASYWVRPDHLAAATIIKALHVISVLVALQVVQVFYESGLMGLQQQVTVNVILAATGTVRAIASVAVLSLVSPTIFVFLATQAMTTGASVIVFRTVLWRSISNTPGKLSYRPELVRSLWRYAAGTSGIAVANALFYQTDKVLLSRLLTLKAFGYYILAQNVAAVLWSLIRPISASVFPRLSELVAAGNKDDLLALYHAAAQSMSVFLLPAGMMITLFSYDLLSIWTHDDTLASNAGGLAAIAAIGIMSAGLADIPHFLRLAYGWVRLSLMVNAVLSLFLLPLLILGAIKYGAIGGVTVWAAVNVAYLVITVPLTHQRILRGSLSAWVRNDTVIPLVCATITGVLLRIAIPRHGEPVAVHLLQLCLAGGIILTVTAISTTGFRKLLLTRVRTQGV